MVKIALETIKVKGMNIDQYETEIRKVIDEETDTFEKMFKQVSGGFSTPQPTYKKQVRKVSNKIEGTTSTSDRRMVHLNLGTAGRWAVMSDDFRAQTTPRSLRARGRQGKTVIRGRRAMTVRGIAIRPGIKAREWTKVIVEQRQQPFTNKMRRAMKLAADHTF